VVCLALAQIAREAPLLEIDRLVIEVHRSSGTTSGKSNPYDDKQASGVAAFIECRESLVKAWM
jgi:hypothetical protein